MKKLTITDQTQNQRLDKYLKRYLPQAGTGFLYRMLREKKIKLNDKKAEGSAVMTVLCREPGTFAFHLMEPELLRRRIATVVRGVQR